MYLGLFSASRIGWMKRLLALIVFGLLTLTMAQADENGVSVYPAGVETIMPGVMPPLGKTLFLEFNNFYQADGTMDGNGHSAVPGFHLRVAAVAGKTVHNWGVHALGGVLVSSVALPIVNEHLTLPIGAFEKTGIANPDIGVLAVAYAKGSWHWWYGFDVYAPGFQYNKNAVLNVGQHYFATAPEGAFTYLPHRGRTEISSKLQYIVNTTNPANQYKSGNDFVWEYAVMQKLTKKLAVGANGFDYQQTTRDFQNGVLVGTGNQARAFAPGPEVKYHLGSVAVILKYQKEVSVENRTKGNAFWFQIGVPLWHHEE